MSITTLISSCRVESLGSNKRFQATASLRSALGAIRQWRFEPAIKDGVSIAVRTAQRIDFEQ